MGAMLNKLEQRKGSGSIPAKVEHPLRVIKRQFGHVKVRAIAGWLRTRRGCTPPVRTLESVDGVAYARPPRTWPMNMQAGPPHRQRR